MQIKLVESDIRAGIALYLNSRGITGITAESLQVTFTAGRKGGGLTADVVTEANAQVTKEKVPDRVEAALGSKEPSGVEGAKEAAEVLETRREVAEAKEPAAENGVKAEAEPEAKPEVVADKAATTGEAKDEGGSLFS